MRKEMVAVACTSADGSPYIGLFETNVTEEQYDLGEHYDNAEEQAISCGYEGPFQCFDNSEHWTIIAAAKALQKLKAGGYIE